MSAPTIDKEEAWAAVAGRDASRDGAFVYAVVTTGVFCRPGCASRRPKRANVRFFAGAEEAAAAGFRPCKRCRPHDDGPSAALRAVERARRYLDAHLDETVTLERLAAIAHLSPFHLQRTFKRRFGVSPRAYVEARRAARLRTRLRAGEGVLEAGFAAGYGSASQLYEQADARLGMTPATYRRGGEGMLIRFATAATPLGRVLVAATSRGICAVSLGDDDDALESSLRREYPRADVRRDDGELTALVAAILAHLEGTGEPSLPLDVRATAFQERVWQALRRIPYGERRTYGEIAAALGRPRAARAVARAVASNPTALLVPCHRVVRADGKAGGYRWGEERKRRLLRREARVVAARKKGGTHGKKGGTADDDA
ncbi:MAG: bifunctional DNA-binding transcriptional regulator/O6-methylguanine-DNA methyltransferase Ada [Acidobacteria bacterium]|nr:MAG: bifunctional DNA-binding transcriptional regulator/O6-methylguanine-DNA methyltransferase Ada [Acidobacteriota bacterium]